MAPYWCYAIELFPEFKKKGIQIARFICRQRRKTFSLLPTQLIPYFQYTVGFVVGPLFFRMECWQMGQKGFHGASVKVDEVDPGNLLTLWLITCWLVVVLRGLRRAHAVLKQFYNLDGMRSVGLSEEAAAYFAAFSLKPQIDGLALWMGLVNRYSRTTGQFLFGTPSQYCNPVRPSVLFSKITCHCPTEVSCFAMTGPIPRFWAEGSESNCTELY